MFFTPRGNIGDLEYCNYPTIRSFHIVIQLFDVKFMAITPHSLVMFQLQNVRHVNDAFSINKHIYITWKVSRKNTPTVTLI